MEDKMFPNAITMDIWISIRQCTFKLKEGSHPVLTLLALIKIFIDDIPSKLGTFLM